MPIDAASFRPPRCRTRVKFCGLVRPADVDAAVAIGVDAIGLVFYPRSPRLVDLETAAALRRRLPSWVQAVGLFVNASAESIGEVRRRVGIDVIQFHGDETPAQVAAVLAGLPASGGAGTVRGWWKALRVGATTAPGAPGAAGAGAAGAGLGDAVGADPPTGRVAGDPRAVAAAAAAFGLAEHCLLDSISAGYGGSGHRFDWSLIPAALAHRLILSGGLDAESVGEAVRRIRPFAVDTSSGIQGADARQKDVGRMERFMHAVQEADRIGPGHGTGASQPVP